MSEISNDLQSLMTIPRGYIANETLRLDISDVNRIEARIPEIVRANPITLTELIVDFNIALSRLSSIIARVELEMRDAERAVKENEAIALLEKVEEILKAKGIKSSADMREAAVTLDPEVKDSRRRYDILKSTLVFLSHKRNAIELAYYSAKKVNELNQMATPMVGGYKERI